MNKVHGGVNKLPSVNQLVGQPPPHSSAAGSNLGPMGESPGHWGPKVGWGGPKGGPGSRHSAQLWTHTWDSRQLPPSSSSGPLAGGRATDGPLSLPGLGKGCTLPDGATCLLPGPGILNNHAHTLPANGEMSGSHSSQSVVSGSHCTPPPPYHADPSLVR